MARPTEINYEAVAKAAQAISEIGLEPSARKIREKLKTGSLTTILKHFNLWQLKSTQEPKAIEPGALDKSITAAIIQHIQMEVKEGHLDIAAQLDDQGKENLALLEHVDKLELELEALSAEKEQLKEKNAEVHGMYKVLVGERSLLNQRLKTAAQELESLKVETAVSEAYMQSQAAVIRDNDNLASKLAKETKRADDAVNELERLLNFSGEHK